MKQTKNNKIKRSLNGKPVRDGRPGERISFLPTKTGVKHDPQRCAGARGLAIAAHTELPCALYYGVAYVGAPDGKEYIRLIPDVRTKRLIKEFDHVGKVSDKNWWQLNAPGEGQTLEAIRMRTRRIRSATTAGTHTPKKRRKNGARVEIVPPRGGLYRHHFIETTA